MQLHDKTYAVQQLLARYCRDGKEVTLPGTVPHRLVNYRRLVFNNVDNTIRSAFPIATKYIDSHIFDEMIAHFFQTKDNTSPLLWKMPFAFYTFCLEMDYAKKYKLPFLNDLLRFEWLEIELFMMEDKAFPKVQQEGDIFSDVFAFNPEHRLEKFTYPVHLKDPPNAAQSPGEYFLLMYREQSSGKVQFVNLSMLFAYVLERLTTESVSLNTILEDILYLFGINDLDLLKDNLKKFVSDLRSKGFIIAYRS